MDEKMIEKARLMAHAEQDLNDAQMEHDRNQRAMQASSSRLRQSKHAADIARKDVLNEARRLWVKGYEPGLGPDF